MAALLATGGFTDLAHRPSQLHISGTQILNEDDRPVLLRGVNAASLEWTSDGEGHILDTVNEAIKNWHVNIIRIPVSQDRWFGVAPEQHDHGVEYRALVRKVVDTIAEQGCYVIFDLHWNDGNQWGQAIGQHVMPDDNSATFWRDAARTFRNDPAVIFDLYNEPHDVSWDVWKNGGTVKDQGPTVRQPHNYHTPGMQALLNTVRNQGAKNVVLCGGLDWAYDMSGFLKGYTLSDPDGYGVIYANHDYPFKGDTVAQWLAKMEKATAKVPVIVSEFGGDVPPPGTTRRMYGRVMDPKWLPETLEILRTHRWNWTAWDLHPAAGPTLVSNWSYAPTPSFGAYVKKELETPLNP
ncbi:MAG TPA: cellulase family glycosylhydrolase [Fimbriimonas sp.]|nr:cellulase family glycosylhydrolase [Fimbriimonas sp.]